MKFAFNFHFRALVIMLVVTTNARFVLLCFVRCELVKLTDRAISPVRFIVKEVRADGMGVLIVSANTFSVIPEGMSVIRLFIAQGTVADMSVFVVFPKLVAVSVVGISALAYALFVKFVVKSCLYRAYHADSFVPVIVYVIFFYDVLMLVVAAFTNGIGAVRMIFFKINVADIARSRVIAFFDFPRNRYVLVLVISAYAVSGSVDLMLL